MIWLGAWGCDTCDALWPVEDRYRTCPICKEKTDWLAMKRPMPAQEAERKAGLVPLRSFTAHERADLAADFALMGVLMDKGWSAAEAFDSTAGVRARRPGGRSA